MLEIMAAIDAYRQTKYALSPLPTKEYWEDAEGANYETMYRSDPAPLVDKKYINGNYFATFNFSYYSKSNTADEARHVCEAILTALEIGAYTGLFGTTSGELNATARPAPIGKDERGRQTFVVSFSLKYYVEV